MSRDTTPERSWRFLRHHDLPEVHARRAIIIARSCTGTVGHRCDRDGDRPISPSGLLAVFGRVPDPWKRGGARNSLPMVLALATCAVLAGARSFAAIDE
jgi:hypothetical protein